MSSKVQFQTNIPVEVALAYDGGKQVEGNFGPQVMFSLAQAPNGETTMYVPPIVADRLAELNIRRGQLVEICKAEVKNGNRRSIQWKVNRVDPDPAWQEPTGEPRIPAAPASPKAAKPKEEAAQPPTPEGVQSQSTIPANGNGAGHIPTNGNGHATLNGIPYWDPKTELRRCYNDAIEVLVAARDAAASKGLPVQFTGDDLRQVAATLYIDAGKDRRTPWNGGAR